MRTRLAAVLAAVALLPATPGAQGTTLREVLARAAIYVEDFRQQLSGIVAEETYVQEEIPGGGRVTRSDLLLVQSGIFPRWLQYRDTFEVDGRPVRDRAERMTALFLDAGVDARQQAQAIARESTRDNLGGVIRTINVPLMPLVILEPDVQQRFRFSRGADREAPKVADGRFRQFQVHVDERIDVPSDEPRTPDDERPAPDAGQRTPNDR